MSAKWQPFCLGLNVLIQRNSKQKGRLKLRNLAKTVIISENDNPHFEKTVKYSYFVILNNSDIIMLKTILLAWKWYH